ncbi:MAG: efflux RND transporter permease subunit, partial [Bdellovibrionales bacterium]|nr:efflux RND transporter permease subunit [Bdellovibrionales bacterium]
MRAIIAFFGREHLFGNLITLMIFIFGIYGAYEIRRDIWPNVDFNTTTIATILPGASPEQVEKLIVNPIEEGLREVDGLKKILSTASENTAITVIQLDPDARNPDKTNQDIRPAIDRVDDLPDAAEKPVVNVIETGTLPVIEVTVQSKELSNIDVRDAAKDLSRELSLLKQVASVDELGDRKKEYLVEARPVDLARRRVSLSDLIRSIQARNISLPGGTVESNEGKELLVRTESEYKTPESLLATVLQSNEAGYGTSLKDVADVRVQLAEPTRLYKSHGEPASILVVAKKANADTYDLINNVKAETTDFSKRVGEKYHFGYSNDFSIYLTNRLNALGSNLAIGLFLVMIVLVFFLPWQVTLVVAIGIPVALLSTLMTAYLMGWSLNLISLIGLIIVLGMLVDDAIVVTENVWRHVEMGKPLLEATVEGAREVFGPVLASVLTTVSAFAPMLFMTGIFGAFVFEIPLMVILALSFSFLEAFFIMPSHFTSWVGTFSAHHMSRPKEEREKPHWFDRVALKYQQYVEWSLRFRYFILVTLMGALVLTGVLLAQTGRFILFPGEGIELFFVQVEAPSGTPIEKLSKLMEPIEKAVAEMPKEELKDFVTSLGIIQQD